MVLNAIKVRNLSFQIHNGLQKADGKTERELDIKESGSFLDEEPDEKESEVEEESIAEEKTDEEGETEADGMLQTSPDDPLEETDDANDENEQQTTRNSL
ncbi:Hypothetical predicted protein [Octopus vulgaris]|uniref:Uncharacterized protein n=1 Tax=Octopus vulgaris TaxID=6645 RepID=A0AA36B2H7_OCTVU|nr:Hypothetical predicted protein [Octopus vulgaris]